MLKPCWPGWNSGSSVRRSRFRAMQHGDPRLWTGPAGTAISAGKYLSRLKKYLLLAEMESIRETIFGRGADWRFPNA